MEGNKSITFTVSKQEIIAKIGTNSYYRSERLKEDMGAVAARVQSGADDGDVLKDELDIAIANVVTIISRYLGRCDVEESEEVGDIKINFNVLAASLFPDDMTAMVEKAITAYLFDRTLEGWVLINMPSEMQALGSRSESDAQRLRHLLIERSKPIR